MNEVVLEKKVSVKNEINEDNRDSNVPLVNLYYHGHLCVMESAMEFSPSY